MTPIANCFEKYVTMVKYYYSNMVTMGKVYQYLTMHKSFHHRVTMFNCFYKNIINIKLNELHS